LPIGVATYNTSGTLPAAYKDFLPSAQVISAKINDFFNTQTPKKSDDQS